MDMSASAQMKTYICTCMNTSVIYMHLCVLHIFVHVFFSTYVSFPVYPHHIVMLTSPASAPLGWVARSLRWRRCQRQEFGEVRETQGNLKKLEPKGPLIWQTAWWEKVTTWMNRMYLKDVYIEYMNDKICRRWWIMMVYTMYILYSTYIYAIICVYIYMIYIYGYLSTGICLQESTTRL